MQSQQGRPPIHFSQHNILEGILEGSVEEVSDEYLLGEGSEMDSQDVGVFCQILDHFANVAGMSAEEGGVGGREATGLAHSVGSGCELLSGDLLHVNKVHFEISFSNYDASVDCPFGTDVLAEMARVDGLHILVKARSTELSY